MSIISSISPLSMVAQTYVAVVRKLLARGETCLCDHGEWGYLEFKSSIFDRNVLGMEGSGQKRLDGPKKICTFTFKYSAIIWEKCKLAFIILISPSVINIGSTQSKLG